MDTLTLVECQRITAGRCCRSALRPNFPWTRSPSRSLPLACSVSSAFYSSLSSCPSDHLMMLSNFCSAWICGGEARYLSVSHDRLPQWRAQQYAWYCFFPLTHTHIRTAIFFVSSQSVRLYYAFMSVWDALCTYVWLYYAFMSLIQLCMAVLCIYVAVWLYYHLCPCISVWLYDAFMSVWVCIHIHVCNENCTKYSNIAAREVRVGACIILTLTTNRWRNFTYYSRATNAGKAVRRTHIPAPQHEGVFKSYQVSGVSLYGECIWRRTCTDHEAWATNTNGQADTLICMYGL